MHLKITVKIKTNILLDQANNLPILYHNDDILIQGSNITHKWKNDLNDSFFVSGYIIGERSSNEKLIPVKNYNFLESPNSLDRFEGRYVCVKISESGICEIYCDNYSRSDIYWLRTKDTYIISTTLADLPIKGEYAEIDQIGLSQSLTIYGSRPLKKHTLYKNVKRLGVNESLIVENNSMK